MARSVSLDDALADDEEATSERKPTARSTGRKTKEPARPVKLTIELEPELHRQLKRFALLEAEDASLASIIRAAVVVMGKNERYAKAVINEAVNQKRRRGVSPGSA